MSDESEESKSTSGQSMDLKRCFFEYTELKSEYSILILLLSVLSTSNSILKFRPENEDVSVKISAACDSIKSRMVFIGDWMSSTGNVALAMSGLIEVTPPTEKKQ